MSHFLELDDGPIVFTDLCTILCMYEAINKKSSCRADAKPYQGKAI